LFGVRGDSGFTALAAVGPGPKAVHSPVFHQPDADHLNREYQKLLERWPGLEWIGSLHVHPYGMPYLSGHDRNTVERIFGDPSLRLSEFVAGIMQRRGQCVAIYPYVIDRDDRSPWLTPLEIVSTQSDVWRNAERTAKRPPQDIHAFSPTTTVGCRFWRRLMDSASFLASLMRRITTRMRRNQTLKENMNE
jgi:proteasome lid subunit RPN8/RPN11